MKIVVALPLILLLASARFAGAAEELPGRHAVPREHPRLMGPLSELRQMAKSRPAEYQRMAAVARNDQANDYSRIISAALVAAIENDSALGKKVQQWAMKYVNGPIRKGHVPFANDLALCGIAYDYCYPAWPEADRKKFIDYLNATIDANVQSETHVFHNGWYGYKNWGIGLACYASYHENERAPGILKALEEDYRIRAAPALELAGEGGGWAEGYYIHYWLYEWLFFCEVARRCEGVDYYAMAPKFYANRAVAAMFETFPGISRYGSRRSVPMGDGGGRLFGGERDKSLCARRIIVNYYRNDPRHQAVHTFNETTPRCAVGDYAYKDFLWHDPAVTRGDLRQFPLSHLSSGAGYVYARSSWDEDATYLFFKCGDRFTAHQHLDVGHFVIYKYEELAGDGGHYEEFGTVHDVNYHMRSIAHSTMLVHDPEEKWPGIRAGKVTGNDGGQTHSWRHHNGAMGDVADWQRQKDKCDIADIVAFRDQGNFLYVAGDGTRAYSSNKLELFTRQIVFLRPNTFVILDHVKTREPEYQKTWLLQAMRPPTRSGEQLIITNGKGRLFVQSLLPLKAEIRLQSGEELYRYGGRDYPPERKIGAAPECRIEISPREQNREEHFLHILTAADSSTESAPRATVTRQGSQITLGWGQTRIEFAADRVGGHILLDGVMQPLK